MLSRTRRYGEKVGLSEPPPPSERIRASHHARASSRIMISLALRFRTADVDNSGYIDYGEFRSMLASRTLQRVRPAVVRGWFDTLDLDSDGYISMAEYFLSSLQLAAWLSGAGLTSIFSAYDQDNSGYVSQQEFETATMAMGFADVATDMFHKFDGDRSGSISLLEIINRVRAISLSNKDSANLRAFLKAIEERIDELQEGSHHRATPAHDRMVPRARSQSRAKSGEEAILEERVKRILHEATDEDGLRQGLLLQVDLMNACSTQEGSSPLLSGSIPSDDRLIGVIQLFQHWDLNHDGMLDKHELLVYVKKLISDEECWRARLRGIVDDVLST